MSQPGANLTRRTLFTGTAITLAAQTLKLPSRIRVAIVGLDGHPGEITKPLNEVPDLDIVGIAGAEAGDVRRFTRRNPRLADVQRFDDYRRMLDTLKPDVVAVCNNNGERAAAIVEAANRKLNVIAEKPLALNRADLARVRTAVESHGVHLGMLLPMRYESSYAALRDIVRSGEIGDVIQISAQKSYQLGKREEWYKHRATYGSTILWIGIHMFDLMRFTSGRDMTEASSFMGRVGFPGYGDMETTTATAFRLDNGGTATLHMDYCLPASAPAHGDDRLRLSGTKGVAEYMAATGTTLATTTKKPHRIDTLPPEGSVFRDYLAHVYGGAPATLTTDEIYSVCEITIAANEAAVERRIVKCRA
jgi:predicted dehydrogenase